MVHIGTGSAVYDNDTRGELWQTVHIPENATTLSFTYRLLTREFDRPQGQRAQDHFYITLVDPGAGKVLKGWTFELSKMTKYFWRGRAAAGAAQKERGPYWLTNWYRTSLDVSQYRGRDIILAFIVTDTGDTNYDTHALIDDVRIA